MNETAFFSFYAQKMNLALAYFLNIKFFVIRMYLP